MDTLEFLKTLLPEGGVKFVAQWIAKSGHPKGGYFTHTPFFDLDEMADHIKRLADAGETVYHACSAYKEVQYKTTDSGYQYVVGRTKENALSAKALWLDFDVGKDAAHAYESKKEAVTCLNEFVQAFKLPRPMVVDSGNGIHAYFLLNESLPRTEWEMLANKFRATCDEFNLKYDPSRSSDIASILRPAGSRNTKNPEHHKIVTVKCAPVPADAEMYDQIFQAYLDEQGIVPQMPKMDFGGSNSDLIVNVEYPASSALIVVEHCNQIRQFAETGGVSEPVWYTCLGLLKHCTDGEEYAHAWASNHSDYDEAVTQAKMDQWSYGPPTCDKFRDINASACEGCTKSCKSPIQLGHAEPENVEHTPLKVKDDIAPEARAAHGPGSIYWPKGYSIANGYVTVARTDDEGVVRNIPIAAPAFWVVSEVRDEDSEWLLHIRAEIREGKFHDFDIPMSAVSEASKLRTALASNRVFSLNSSAKQGAELVSYVSEQGIAMQRFAEEINTCTQMGWNSDKTRFLLGDSLITSQGVMPVRVGSSIININADQSSLVGAMSSAGTLQEYHDGVMHLYGSEGMEAYQYVLATALGAYLSPFVRNDMWHGIPLSVYSSKSGYGKTTVAAIGLNAVCHAAKSKSSDGTLRAFKKMLSIYGSMPVFYDEFTDKLEPPEQKDLLYNWSQGIERMGLHSDGTMRKRGASWNNMGILTTNKSVLHCMTESSTDPEASQVRMMEIDLAEYVPRKPSADNQALATHLSTDVYGLVAAPLIKFLIRNAEEITLQIAKEFESVTRRLPHHIATTGRFMCYHAACSLVGAKLGRKLGLWDFNIANIREFIVRHILNQLDKIAAYHVAGEDRFAAMMADFNGRILVTSRYDTLDGRKRSTEDPLVAINGPIVGRYATGCAGTKADPGDPGRLYIMISAITEWCRKNDLNSVEVRQIWKTAGLIETKRGSGPTGEKRVILTKGVPVKPMPAVRCVEFVVGNVRGAIPGVPEPTAEIIPIKQSHAQSH